MSSHRNDFYRTGQNKLFFLTIYYLYCIQFQETILQKTPSGVFCFVLSFFYERSHQTHSPYRRGATTV